MTFDVIVQLFLTVSFYSDPPTYAESVGGAVRLWDDDDDDDDSPEENMGDFTYTPMYTYVYNYRPPPGYTEVVQVNFALDSPIRYYTVLTLFQMTKYRYSFCPN